jgi:hypothetical protein
MKNSKILLSFILVFLLILPLNAKQKNRFKFGLYTGWSKGSELLERGYYRGFITLKNHIGGYIQYDLTQRFGLQLNMNYQRGVLELEEEWLPSPDHSGKDPFQILSVSLCGVLSTKVQKVWQFYFLAGGGLSAGEWDGFERNVYYNFMAGLGIKIFFLKSNPRIALNLGGSFHHLIEYFFEEDHAGYTRFHVGFEF